jgi:hypothetical protein
MLLALVMEAKEDTATQLVTIKNARTLILLQRITSVNVYVMKQKIPDKQVAALFRGHRLIKTAAAREKRRIVAAAEQ